MVGTTTAPIVLASNVNTMLTLTFIVTLVSLIAIDVIYEMRRHP